MVEKHSRFWRFATKETNRTLFGDVVNMLVVEPIENRQHRKENKEREAEKPAQIVWIWPGYAPEEQAFHAMKVVEETLGFKPSVREPQRDIYYQSPAEHYSREIRALASKKDDKIDAIVATDIKFRNGRGETDEAFIEELRKTAAELGLPFHYIPAAKLFGKDDKSLTTEIKDLNRYSF